MMLTMIAWLVAIPPTVALVVYSVEVLLGLRHLSTPEPPAAMCNAAILIPAHNEAALIRDTVSALLAATEGSDPPVRLLVVADNCSDSTAQRAREAGAEVAERSDPSKQGKGFALGFGRDYLAADPPAVVLVIDADCRIDGRSINHVIGTAFALQEPVQAVDLLIAPSNSLPLVKISNFAMLVKNLVRARGLYRCGGGIPLFGTGMAFPWSVFGTCRLASADTVEDLRLSLDLARQGISVHLDEKATVISASAAAEDTGAQRRRWELGFLRTAARDALPILAEGVAHRSRHLITLGLHLCVPPLALLLLFATACLGGTAAIAAATGNRWPAAILLSAITFAVVATLLAWWKEGRSTLALATLGRAPFYVISKIPVYLSVFTSRQVGWNRTRRPNERR
ncbi:MAG: glycosyltransferase [Novosphingobium sp.]|nr:glycosyltransferase [Novosphingobium sp.]